MHRPMLLALAVVTTLGVSISTGQASSGLRDTLTDRFRLSRIEVQNPGVEGHVMKQGTVLRLQRDGMPANVLRTVQANTKSPRFHVRDYARVEVRQDGQLTLTPGALSLTKGTPLVVLDVKVDPDRVHLFTHTLDPVRLPDGRAAYGCTEFVFIFDPATLHQEDIATVVASRIDQWLSVIS